MKRRIRWWLALAGLGLMLAAPNLAAAAQAPTEGLNLTTSPLPISLTAKPGTTVSTQLRIRNSGTQTETLKVHLMKFSAYGEEGKPLLQERGPGDTYFDWVTFTPSVFSAAPNVWQTVTMTIKLPPSAALGYYYAVTFGRANDQPVTPGQRQTAIQGAAATLVLVDAQVPGAKRQINIASFTANHSLYEFLPADFTIRLHNGGNVHVAPTGNIFITRGGHDVAEIPINQDGGNILPDSNRIFTASWADGFPVYTLKTSNGDTVLDSHGQPAKQLKWDFSQLLKLRFGHYTAHLVMAYDDGTRDVPIEATLSFWVIPWRLIITAILIPTLPAILVYAFMKRKYGGKK